jgi:Sulfotransferase domain
MQPLNFLVPGFSKCGTTTLCALLSQHPDIFISDPKEPRFFSTDHYDRNWHSYQALFKPSRPGQQLGEGSTSYSTEHREVLSRERILKHYPDIKLIFIARDPRKRIESSYREFHHSGPNYGLNTPFTIAQALKELPVILRDSCYWERICNYRNYMPEENIHVVFLEQLQQNPQKTLETCFRFLNVDCATAPISPQLILNAGSEKYYDTRLLRTLRTNPHTGFKLAKIPVRLQHRLLCVLGLRRPFRRALEWDSEAHLIAQEALSDDIRLFLRHYDEGGELWPTMR